MLLSWMVVIMCTLEAIGIPFKSRTKGDAEGGSSAITQRYDSSLKGLQNFVVKIVQNYFEGNNLRKVQEVQVQANQVRRLATGFSPRG